MIKQIVDFSRDDQGRAAVIEVFMMVEDPHEHIEAIKVLIKDGAIIQSADADTIRAVYRGTNQDKLLSLIDEGWNFSGEVAEALDCQDQADKALCRECIEPCDIRDGKGSGPCTQ